MQARDEDKAAVRPNGCAKVAGGSPGTEQANGGRLSFVLAQDLADLRIERVCVCAGATLLYCLSSLLVEIRRIDRADISS
jgi:hypothetical protein